MADCGPVLQACGVGKVFREGGREFPVLTDVSLNLAVGEIVSLEGRSGSGKTTLLSILGCILSPTAGQVTVEGRLADTARPEVLAAIRRRSIGFVFQQFNLFQALTCLENVEYALNLKGCKGGAARREAWRVIEAVGLADHAGFLPRDISGGQKQRVAIARALAGRSPVLLADEPTANLDSATASGILQLFRQLVRQEGRALLIVTHDHQVRTIADRTLFIQDGRLVDGQLE
ncbi:MAG: ABC transporter ATP-binding protein [Candidatus Methylumidiphilus sp.]